MAAVSAKLSLLLLLVSGHAFARDAPAQHGRSLLGFSGATECWAAILELRSCTNEIILFLLNGESYLGQDCCRAIRVITRQCWPSMLASLGFTAEEGDILRGYCEAVIDYPPPPPAAALPPSPVPAPLGILA